MGRHEAEATIRALFTQGALDVAAEAALSAYGPEILSWLSASLHERIEAREVYSTFMEDFWRGLPHFRLESSFRTWMYCLARNAACRSLRSRHRDEPLSISQLALQAATCRSETDPWLRTDVKDRFAQLRVQLTTEERMILMLRVDERMAWDDIARIMSGVQSEAAEELRRRAMGLRKQFERLKQRLRDMAVTDGLVESD